MAFAVAHPVITSLIVAGAGMEIASQYQQARAYQEQAEYNARVAELQAQQVERAQKLEEYRLNRAKEALLGKQRALYAKAGVSLEGSPLEVLADTEAQYQLDLSVSRYNADVQKRRLGYEAGYQRYAGKQYMRAGYLGMGTTLLTTGTKLGLLGLPQNTGENINA
ncbi:MAG: hypothetical protein NC818_07375 [Candidatus Omnitrophica bacterium]|nr:hypothetical protein [Candidatus Omnitrophota bacterium]